MLNILPSRTSDEREILFYGFVIVYCLSFEEESQWLCPDTNAIMLYFHIV